MSFQQAGETLRPHLFSPVSNLVLKHYNYAHPWLGLGVDPAVYAVTQELPQVFWLFVSMIWLTSESVKICLPDHDYSQLCAEIAQVRNAAFNMLCIESSVSLYLEPFSGACQK